MEWQVKAEDLLVAVGQKKPLFTAQEQAAETLEEVEDFIEKGDARQKARLFKLNEMAIELYSKYMQDSAGAYLDFARGRAGQSSKYMISKNKVVTTFSKVVFVAEI